MKYSNMMAVDRKYLFSDIAGIAVLATFGIATWDVNWVNGFSPGSV
ncbi:hypothetical protein [Sphingorhabdus sp. YGSMI21]|nr:hypothetical protein [Sphingorhabdus sp. YGSMI21]